MRTTTLYDQVATLQMKINATAKMKQTTEVKEYLQKLSYLLAEITRQLDLIESAS